MTKEQLQQYKEETVYRLTENDFQTMAVGELGRKLSEAELSICKNKFAFDWIEYVGLFITDRFGG